MKWLKTMYPSQIVAYFISATDLINVERGENSRTDVPFGSTEIGTNTKNIKSPISLIYSGTYIITEGLQQCVYNKSFALKYYLILRYRL